MATREDMHLRVSPNGVDHLMIRGRCATCGLGPHDDWPARAYEPTGGTYRPIMALVVTVLTLLVLAALRGGPL